MLAEGGFNTEEAWKAVVRTFEAKGLTADDALVQARLARIVRDSDWDSEKMEVKLWTPTVLGERKCE
jgi:DNA polymerase-1